MDDEFRAALFIVKKNCKEYKTIVEREERKQQAIAAHQERDRRDETFQLVLEAEKKAQQATKGNKSSRSNRPRCFFI
jgi:hypothetical protein